MERNPWLQTLIILLVGIAALYLGATLWQLAVRFTDIILPFVLAATLAYMLTPLVDFLVRRARLPRVGAIAIVYLVLLLLIGVSVVLVAPPLVVQTVQLGSTLPALVQEIPRYLDQVQRVLDSFDVPIRLGGQLALDATALERVQGIGAAIAQNALALAQGIASTVFNLIIVLILSFYFLLDGNRFVNLGVSILPDRYHDDAWFFIETVNRSFGGFLRGMLVQAIVYGIGTGIVMGVAGLPFVLVVSLFAGFLVVIPFVGTVVAIVPPVVLAALTGDWFRTLLVFAALMLLQQLLINILAPKIMSDSVGLHPLVIFAAVFLGAKEAGVWGAIFSVPLAAVIWAMVLFAYQEWRQRQRRQLVGLDTAAPPDETLSIAAQHGGAQ